MVQIKKLLRLSRLLQILPFDSRQTSRKKWPGPSQVQILLVHLAGLFTILDKNNSNDRTRKFRLVFSIIYFPYFQI